LEVQNNQVMQAKQAINPQSTTTTSSACKCFIYFLYIYFCTDALSKPLGKCSINMMLL